jgi:hypothetical protein
MTSHYSKIRFIGYPIPTSPEGLNLLDNTGIIAGTYRAHEDIIADITQRVKLLQDTVGIAKQALPAGEDPQSVLNVFVAPEFFFHGALGPYVFPGGVQDPGAIILEQLKVAFPGPDYANWMFVAGTAITAQVDNIQNVFAAPSTAARNEIVKVLANQGQKTFGRMGAVVLDLLNTFIQACQASPLVVVRDRALIVSNILLDSPRGPLNSNAMTSDKYFVSLLDLVLTPSDPNANVVTQQMAAYTAIDLSNGDLKALAFDEYAIFRQNYVADNQPPYLDFGVEICLDHSDVRLRGSIDREPFPKPTDSIRVHLIPSCGMSIARQSVAAGAGGFVFNCDGKETLDDTSGPQAATLSEVPCIYANYVDPNNSNYAGHTQLAQVKRAAVGGSPHADGSSNATFYKLDPAALTIVPLPETADHGIVFAGGAGALHIYGPFDITQQSG